MFGSAILDTAIGLIFVYLVISLIVSAANELLAAVFRLRAQNLFLGIRELLQDPSATGLVSRFYEHPLIEALAAQDKKPSYIPSRTFALTLLDIVSPVAPAGNRTLDDLKAGLRFACSWTTLGTTWNSSRNSSKLGSIPRWNAFPVGTNEKLRRSSWP